MQPRLTVWITPDDVGSRVSVRSRLPAATAGGPTVTDTVGYLLSWANDELRIQRRDGSVATLTAGELLAGKVLPGPPPDRRRG